VLVSPIGGTADLPPVAEGHDAELASLVNLRASGSPGPVELPSVHMPRAFGPFRGGRMVRGDAVRPALRRIVEARHGARGCRTTERLLSVPEAGRSHIGRRMVPAEAVCRAGRVAHPDARVMCWETWQRC
jgi:hypothetical protein